MNRKIYYWKLRTTELQLGERTLIMGVLNVTPDSFSDGGNFSDPDKAYARAIEMEEQGVDIIDIGAESTRPDSKRITADEEWQRLVPVLKRLRDKLRVPISLDTYKSETAERALEYGVEILNDPSGLTFDADLAKVAVAGNAGLILNHMRGLPETWSKQPPMQDPVGTISKDLEATVSRARRMGVEKNRIMIDPGIGFGKRKEQNSEILAQLARLAPLDYPLLVGPSRKSFLMQTSDNDTLYATAAAVTAAILGGAHIVRVHDVKEMRIVAQVADEIVRGSVTVLKPAHDTAERAIPRAPRKEFEDERVKPTRPPLSRPATPPPPPSPPRESFAPAAKERTEDRPIVRRPPQDRPSKGWSPAGDRPQRSGPPQDRGGRDGGKPPYRGGSQDRPPRRDFQDRPERGERPPFRGAPSQGRPAFRSGPGQDRPSRGPSSDRPPFRGGEGRPPFRGGDGRPPRGDSNDRPARGPAGGRPGSGPPSGRPSWGPPRGSSQGRPSQGRPPQGRPPQGRPPQGGAPRRPFRKRP